MLNLVGSRRPLSTYETPVGNILTLRYAVVFISVVLSLYEITGGKNIAKAPVIKHPLLPRSHLLHHTYY
ncbi:hypothetical protein AX774_g4560 [Zancudomyces culisetae]|uniref:Uncharacterized protein n=1 Tax=Zancudomyces culisetae TaxID=1213189 RepID=A0A1R1PLY3_ZANCU|nr:hypothetical protein AX774_g4560 [Zancudomyces culisetae]|eukprot:OMH81974.1 hypothetical protein AX774_g4560 [Zancudomyces culisetae]